MFRAVMDKEKIKRWIKFMTTIEKLTDEACFWISGEALHFRDMDAARISMIDFKLEPEYFIEYSFEGEEEIPVCMQSKKLLEFSKLMRNSEEMEIILEEGMTHFVLSTKVPYEKYFAIPIAVDRERSKPGTPELEYTAKIKMVSASLKDALNEAKTISDRLTFIAEGNTITFLSKNDEGFQVRHRLVYPDNLEVLDIKVEEKSVAVYMVKPLLDVVKEIASLSRIAQINFGNSLPLDLKFELVEGEYYEYFLAPRTEE
jgi:DNA polymerase III sliding clamp (beta) subunit (PCNA family)